MTKKIITGKQEIIIILLYIFRFVNSKQIQEFLGHKDHRRLNSWLKDLTIRKFIARDFTPVYGVLTKPAVYSLSILGRKYMRDSFPYSFPQYLSKIARDKDTLKGFRMKRQILADWYLLLLPPSVQIELEKKHEEGINESCTLTNGIRKKHDKNKKHTGIAIVDYLLTQLTTEADKNEKIPINTRQFFTSAYFPPLILLEKMKPDGYIRKKFQNGIAHGLLFIIDAYIPRFLLRYTLKRIFDTLDEEYWEDEQTQSLDIYFLCPNNQIIIYMRRLLTQYIASYYAKTPLRICFATRNQLYNKKNGRTKTVGWKIISSQD